MPGDTVIRVEAASKKYSRSLRHVMTYGAQDIAKDLIGIRTRSDQLRGGEFWAVNDVSFEVKRGETVGLIGSNGSGKSTLLKMLNGIFMPDKGRIEIRGRISALIEVGAGFHPMLTGRENIYINGSILGMSKREIDRTFDEIVNFSGINDFIDSPVKHYSSGMYVRLGFAVAVHSNPDILLIDEVLAVGDINYRLKCMEKIKEFQRSGKSIIFVSHDISAVKKICQRCVWIQNGEIKKIGNANETADLFADHMRKIRSTFVENTSVQSEFLKILGVFSEGSNGEKKEDFNYGDTVCIRIQYELSKPIYGLVFGIALFSGDNICVSALNTGIDGIKLKETPGRNEVCIEYPAINLLAGTYYFDIGFFEEKAVTPFVYLARVMEISVKSSYLGEGLLIMEHKWQSK